MNPEYTDKLLAIAHDVTAFEMQATHRIGTAFAAPQEYGRQAE
jgi:hypothetical protein